MKKESTGSTDPKPAADPDYQALLREDWTLINRFDTTRRPPPRAWIGHD